MPEAARATHAAPACALCGAAVEIGEDVVRTGPFLTRRDPLWRYAGVRLHRRCFERWPERSQFVRKFNIVLDGLATMAEDGSIDDPTARDLTLPPP